MVFVNSQGPAPAMDMAFPDTCNTPVGPAVVPIPYPNISVSSMGIPTQLKGLLMCMPGHNMTTTRAMSNGDNGGVAMGLMSGMVMGPGLAMMGSTNLFLGGPPATKMAMPTKQNGIGPNAFGTTITPSQIKMMSLR